MKIDYISSDIHLDLQLSMFKCNLRIEKHIFLTGTGFVDLCRGLSNPSIFYDGEHSVGTVMGAFDVYVKEADWPELMWIVETL